jgi:hypothetical protein
MVKLNSDDRNKLPAREFAEPKKRAYPIEDKAHARTAKARASQAVNSGRMSKAEEGQIDKKAEAVLKKHPHDAHRRDYPSHFNCNRWGCSAPSS